MENNTKKIKNPVAIIMYVISVLLGLYTIFTMYNSYTYISSLVAQGFVISEELPSVISYCIGASVPYLFYAVSFWAIGYFINKVEYIINEIKKSNSTDIKVDTILTNSDNIQECEEVTEEVTIENTTEDIREDI